MKQHQIARSRQRSRQNAGKGVKRLLKSAERNISTMQNTQNTQNVQNQFFSPNVSNAHATSQNHSHEKNSTHSQLITSQMPPPNGEVFGDDNNIIMAPGRLTGVGNHPSLVKQKKSFSQQRLHFSTKKIHLRSTTFTKNSKNSKNVQNLHHTRQTSRRYQSSLSLDNLDSTSSPTPTSPTLDNNDLNSPSNNTSTHNNNNTNNNNNNNSINNNTNNNNNNTTTTPSNPLSSLLPFPSSKDPTATQKRLSKIHLTPALRHHYQQEIQKTLLKDIIPPPTAPNSGIVYHLPVGNAMVPTGPLPYVETEPGDVGTCVEITMLGTSSATTTKTRGLSAITLRHHGELWLFDAGPTVRERLALRTRATGSSNSKMAKIFLSHLHGDHSMGLVEIILQRVVREAPLSTIDRKAIIFSDNRGFLGTAGHDNQQNNEQNGQNEQNNEQNGQNNDQNDQNSLKNNPLETDSIVDPLEATPTPDRGPQITPKHFIRAPPVNITAPSEVLEVYGPIGLTHFVASAMKFTRPSTLNSVHFIELVEAFTPPQSLPIQALFFNNLPEYNRCHSYYHLLKIFLTRVGIELPLPFHSYNTDLLSHATPGTEPELQGVISVGKNVNGYWSEEGEGTGTKGGRKNQQQNGQNQHRQNFKENKEKENNFDRNNKKDFEALFNTKRSNNYSMNNRQNYNTDFNSANSTHDGSGSNNYNKGKHGQNYHGYQNNGKVAFANFNITAKMTKAQQFRLEELYLSLKWNYQQQLLGFQQYNEARKAKVGEKMNDEENKLENNQKNDDKNDDKNDELSDENDENNKQSPEENNDENSSPSQSKPIKKPNTIDTGLDIDSFLSGFSKPKSSSSLNNAKTSQSEDKGEKVEKKQIIYFSQNDPENIPHPYPTPSSLASDPSLSMLYSLRQGTHNEQFFYEKIYHNYQNQFQQHETSTSHPNSPPKSTHPNARFKHHSLVQPNHPPFAFGDDGTLMGTNAVHLNNGQNGQNNDQKGRNGLSYSNEKNSNFHHNNTGTSNMTTFALPTSPQVFSPNTTNIDSFISIFDLFVSPFWKCLLNLPSLDATFAEWEKYNGGNPHQGNFHKDYTNWPESEENAKNQQKNQQNQHNQQNTFKNDSIAQTPSPNPDPLPSPPHYDPLQRQDPYKMKFFQQKYRLPNGSVVSLDPTNAVNLFFETTFMRHLQLQWTRVDPLTTYAYAEVELNGIKMAGENEGAQNATNNAQNGPNGQNNAQNGKNLPNSPNNAQNAHNTSQNNDKPAQTPSKLDQNDSILSPKQSSSFWNRAYQIAEPFRDDYINYSHYIPLLNTFEGTLNSLSKSHVARARFHQNATRHPMMNLLYSTPREESGFSHNSANGDGNNNNNNSNDQSNNQNNNINQSNNTNSQNNNINSNNNNNNNNPNNQSYTNTPHSTAYIPGLSFNNYSIRVSSNGIYPFATNITDNARFSKPIPFKYKDFSVKGVMQAHSATSWGWVIEENTTQRFDQEVCNELLKKYGSGPYLSSLKRGHPVAIVKDGWEGRGHYKWHRDEVKKTEKKPGSEKNGQNGQKNGKNAQNGPNNDKNALIEQNMSNSDLNTTSPTSTAATTSNEGVILTDNQDNSDINPSKSLHDVQNSSKSYFEVANSSSDTQNPSKPPSDTPNSSKLTSSLPPLPVMGSFKRQLSPILPGRPQLGRPMVQNEAHLNKKEKDGGNDENEEEKKNENQIGNENEKEDELKKSTTNDEKGGNEEQNAPKEAPRSYLATYRNHNKNNNTNSVNKNTNNNNNNNNPSKIQHPTSIVSTMSQRSQNSLSHPFIRRYITQRGHLELPNLRNPNTGELILPSNRPSDFEELWDVVDPYATVVGVEKGTGIGNNENNNNNNNNTNNNNNNNNEENNNNENIINNNKTPSPKLRPLLTQIQGRKIVLLFDSIGGFSMSKSAQKAAMEPDLLVHEATFASNAVDKYEAIIKRHSTAATAANFARHIKAKNLVLNHFSSKYLDDSIVGVVGDRLILRYGVKNTAFLEENSVLKRLFEDSQSEQHINMTASTLALANNYYHLSEHKMTVQNVYVDKNDPKAFIHLPVMKQDPFSGKYVGYDPATNTYLRENENGTHMGANHENGIEMGANHENEATGTYLRQNVQIDANDDNSGSIGENGHRGANNHSPLLHSQQSSPQQSSSQQSSQQSSSQISSHHPPPLAVPFNPTSTTSATWFDTNILNNEELAHYYLAKQTAKMILLPKSWNLATLAPQPSRASLWRQNPIKTEPITNTRLGKPFREVLAALGVRVKIRKNGIAKKVTLRDISTQKDKKMKTFLYSSNSHQDDTCDPNGVDDNDDRDGVDDEVEGKGQWPPVHCVPTALSDRLKLPSSESTPSLSRQGILQQQFEYGNIYHRLAKEMYGDGRNWIWDQNNQNNQENQENGINVVKNGQNPSNPTQTVPNSIDPVPVGLSHLPYTEISSHFTKKGGYSPYRATPSLIDNNDYQLPISFYTQSNEHVYSIPLLDHDLDAVISNGSENGQNGTNNGQNSQNGTNNGQNGQNGPNNTGNAGLMSSIAGQGKMSRKERRKEAKLAQTSMNNTQNGTNGQNNTQSGQNNAQNGQNDQNGPNDAVPNTNNTETNNTTPNPYNHDHQLRPLYKMTAKTRINPVTLSSIPMSTKHRRTVREHFLEAAETLGLVHFTPTPELYAQGLGPDLDAFRDQLGTDGDDLAQNGQNGQHFNKKSHNNLFPHNNNIDLADIDNERDLVEGMLVDCGGKVARNGNGLVQNGPNYVNNSPQNHQNGQNDENDQNDQNRSNFAPNHKNGPNTALPPPAFSSTTSLIKPPVIKKQSGIDDDDDDDDDEDSSNDDNDNNGEDDDIDDDDNDDGESIPSPKRPSRPQTSPNHLSQNDKEQEKFSTKANSAYFASAFAGKEGLFLPCNAILSALKHGTDNGTNSFHSEPVPFAQDGAFGADFQYNGARDGPNGSFGSKSQENGGFSPFGVNNRHNVNEVPRHRGLLIAHDGMVLRLSRGGRDSDV